MDTSAICVTLPGGQEKRLSPHELGSSQSLADFLEEKGVPLNMRCEGRGLCRGCQVELEDEGNSQTIRACQNNAADILLQTQQITVPENSWRDHSLHGVSVFEIDVKSTGKSRHDTGFGLAIDIGTTTLAAALWDFSTSECLAHSSNPNPQARFGDNVVSRINFSIEREDGHRMLQETLLKKGIFPMARELCRKAGIQLSDIVAASLSGNPTMLHTVAGVPLAGLGKYPFKPVFLEEQNLDSSAIGFANSFPVDLLPGLGPFVGSDIAVGALASGMLEGHGPVLLIDFGTNGEILLKYKGGYLATATAAGPAFEGGRLSCGAAARDGIISSLQFENGNWQWRLSGYPGGKPNGISGAAYVDFLALARESGLLDTFGRMDRKDSAVQEREIDGENEYTVELAPSVFISEADVAELLQAKAAIAGGVSTLLELAGIEAGDLKEVLVAGGFGYHLNPESATRVGLLPDVPAERIRMIGNASLGGASLLLNCPRHPDMGGLIDRCKVIELNQVPEFEDHFTDALSLGSLDE